MEIVSVLVYMLSSGMIMAAAYSQSHLLLGLDKSLDCWCARLMADPDFELGVQSWNILQALLKSVGRELVLQLHKVLSHFLYKEVGLF